MLRAERNLVEYALGRLKARCTILTRKIDFKLEVVSIPIKYACLVRMQIEPDKAEEELKNIPDPVY